MRWWTIPDAPSYEISFYYNRYTVRNKKTGQILKQQKDKHGKVCYAMRRPNGKSYHRSPEFLLRVAKAAVDTKSTYQPIPSLDYRYEIDRCGKVRNVKTKQVIKPRRNCKSICVQIGGKGKAHYQSRAVADLLWEVHGQIKKRRFRPCPCACYLRPHCRRTFSNMKDCARYLADKVGLPVTAIYRRLYEQRAATIGDWEITYGGD